MGSMESQPEAPEAPADPEAEAPVEVEAPVSEAQGLQLQIMRNDADLLRFVPLRRPLRCL